MSDNIADRASIRKKKIRQEKKKKRKKLPQSLSLTDATKDLTRLIGRAIFFPTDRFGSPKEARVNRHAYRKLKNLALNVFFLRRQDNLSRSFVQIDLTIDPTTETADFSAILSILAARIC